MGDKLLFSCRVCGIKCDSHPVTQGPDGEPTALQAVCPEHCEDHDYEYDPGDRKHWCKNCGAEPSDDWFYQ